MRIAVIRSTFAFIALAVLTAAAAVPNLFRFQDASGDVATYTVGAIDSNNPFFQSLGTNGRSCAICHLASDAMGLSSASAAARFASTGGTDPLFADVDGANCSGVSRDDASVAQPPRQSRFGSCCVAGPRQRSVYRRDRVRPVRLRRYCRQVNRQTHAVGLSASSANGQFEE